MADDSPKKSHSDLGYGFGSEPTTPTLPEPPERDVLAAMRAVPELLSLPLQGRRDYRSPYPLGSLLYLLMLGGQPPNRDATKTHSEPAAQWAIRRHVNSGRLVETAGKVAPDESLWNWWREPQSTIESTNGQPTQGNSIIDEQSLPTIEVDTKLLQVRYGGKVYNVTDAQATGLKALVDAGGDWVSWSGLGISKPSEVRKSLPDPLGNLIESSQGKGYRLSRQP